MLAIAATAFLVVDGLNTATTGNIVFRGGYLHVRVVRQVDGYLYQSFAVRARTYYYPAIQVLQGTAGNLAGTGCLAIYHHHEWHQRVYGLYPCFIFLAGLLYLSLVFYHGNALG